MHHFPKIQRGTSSQWESQRSGMISPAGPGPSLHSSQQSARGKFILLQLPLTPHCVVLASPKCYDPLNRRIFSNRCHAPAAGRVTGAELLRGRLLAGPALIPGAEHGRLWSLERRARQQLHAGSLRCCVSTTLAGALPNCGSVESGSHRVPHTHVVAPLRVCCRQPGAARQCPRHGSRCRCGSSVPADHGSDACHGQQPVDCSIAASSPHARPPEALSQHLRRGRWRRGRHPPLSRHGRRRRRDGGAVGALRAAVWGWGRAGTRSRMRAELVPSTTFPSDPQTLRLLPHCF